MTISLFYSGTRPAACSEQKITTSSPGRGAVAAAAWEYENVWAGLR